jgi:hypothetical protein
MAGGLDESKGALGWTSGLVDSKEHRGGPVAWLKPKSTRVDTTPRDGVRKLITSSGLHLERYGPWIKMKGSKDYPCIVNVRRNKDK